MTDRVLDIGAIWDSVTLGSDPGVVKKNWEMILQARMKLREIQASLDALDLANRAMCDHADRDGERCPTCGWSY